MKTAALALASILFAGCAMPAEGTVADDSPEPALAEKNVFGTLPSIPGGIVQNGPTNLPSGWNPGLLPPLRLPPSIEYMAVGPRTSNECLQTPVIAGDPAMPSVIQWRISPGTVGISAIRLCRDGTCYHSIPNPSRELVANGYANGPTPPSAELRTPLATAEYALEVVDTEGRVTRRTARMKLTPPTSIELAGTIREFGPSSGPGRRTFRIPVRGHNVGSIHVTALNGSGTSPFARHVVGPAEHWGTFAREIEVSIDFDTAFRYSTWISEGRKISLMVQTATVDGCTGLFHGPTVAAIASGSVTPSTPPSGGSSPSPTPSPSPFATCAWSCDPAIAPGFLRTDSRRRDTCSGGWEYETCRYDDRPAFTTLSICAGQSVPSGWVLREEYSSATRCQSVVYTSNNVKTIQKL
jgi:hypothetical protein